MAASAKTIELLKKQYRPIKEVKESAKTGVRVAKCSNLLGERQRTPESKTEAKAGDKTEDKRMNM